MTRNLKINIKNLQIAEALKKSRLQKKAIEENEKFPLDNLIKEKEKHLPCSSSLSQEINKEEIKCDKKEAPIDHLSSESSLQVAHINTSPADAPIKHLCLDDPLLSQETQKKEEAVPLKPRLSSSHKHCRQDKNHVLPQRMTKISPQATPRSSFVHYDQNQCATTIEKKSTHSSTTLLSSTHAQKQQSTLQEKEESNYSIPSLPEQESDIEKTPNKPTKKSSSPSIRKQAFSRVFDSRDKSGLRIEEEEVWRKKRQNRKRSTTIEQQLMQRPKEVSIRLPITVKDLAATMKLKASEVIQKLLLHGLPMTINAELDDPTTVELIGEELGCTITIDSSQENRLKITNQTVKEEIEASNPAILQPRPPVVTVMGHVDHGKTSLIDALRKSRLAESEIGSITQHIGAFQCETKYGPFTILDTPGHEAFSAIRQRGVYATDIVLLVIAGDEHIMPQTIEAIESAKEAKVPIVVAINKKDKSNFNADNIYRELSDHDLLPECWGGKVITVNCSAVTKEGLDTLKEMLALQAELLELKANPKARARGIVLESEMHKGFGPVVTLLVQNGTLKLGQAIIFEHEYGHVKTMQNEYGNNIQQALPSTPVKITGLSGIPFAGNSFITLENEKMARKIAEERKSLLRENLLRKSQEKNISSLFKQQSSGQEIKTLNIILKADVRGSIDAIKKSISNIQTEKVKVNFISLDVGQISESDAELAEASNAIILGFHTQVESNALSLIKKKNIPLFLHELIYEVIDEINNQMKATLDKIRQETCIGEAVVIALFKSSQIGCIAGCKVEEGIIQRSNLIKIFRKNEKIWEGHISSLKRQKDDIKEAKKGWECGIVLQGFSSFQLGDIIHAFEITQVTQEL